MYFINIIKDAECVAHPYCIESGRRDVELPFGQAADSSRILQMSFTRW